MREWYHLIEWRRQEERRKPGPPAGALDIVMPDNCKLCGRQAQLRLSHIIPRFAVKWFKATSATGFLRSVLSPKRQQEITRKYLLCDDCEQLLSPAEKDFCEKVFIPYHEKHQAVFDYGPWFRRFLIGLHWRVLVARESKDYPPNATAAYEATEHTWRAYLLGISHDPGDAEFHVFFADVIEKTTNFTPGKMNWYFARGFDATPIFNEAGAVGVYAKLIKVMTVSFLTPMDQAKEQWEGTQVGEQGTLRTPQRITTTSFGGFLEDRVRLIERAPRTLTSGQLKKLLQKARSKPEELMATETFKTLKADRELQRRIVARPIVEAMKGKHRNQPCPCNSGRKFKRCCGRG